MTGGIVFSEKISAGLILSGVIFALLIILWILSETAMKKKDPLLAGASSGFFYLFIIFFTQFVHSELRQKIVELDSYQSGKINLFQWEEVIIEGTVQSTGMSSTGKWVYAVQTVKTVIDQELEWNYPYRARLYKGPDNQQVLLENEFIRAVVRIYAYPERRNPHEFDYGNWLMKNGFAAHGEVVEVLSTKNQSRTPGWNKIRRIVQDSADQIFSEGHSTIAKALLLGYKKELTDEQKRQFSRAGLSHIMAVSGLHVGFIVAPFWFLIPFIWGSKKGRVLGLCILTVLLLGYAGLTGFSPSVNRASLMAWLLTYGKLFHKIRNSINLTAVAAMILLLINPNQLFEIGFQLSFSAVLIILILMPEVQRLIPVKLRYGAAGGLISIILVSFIVQLGLFPILIYYFGEFSVIGPIANALVVPLLSFTVPAGLLMVLLSPLHVSFFGFIAKIIETPIYWIQWVAEYLGSWQGSYIQISELSWIIFVIWLILILLFASLRISNVRWKLLILLLISLNGFVLKYILQSSPYLEMEVTFLDVGQADAVHIRTPGGKEVLIDAGRWSPMSNSGDRVLYPYFEHNQIESLDAILLSHPHADHIGGMPVLMEKMNINVVYQSNFEYDSVLYKTIMKLSEEKNIEVRYPVAGEIIEVDPAIRVFVIGPEPGKPINRNPNNHSLSVKIVYGQTHFLFTGDAEVEQENQMAARYGDFLNSNLYKAGHHGSNTSSSELFMQHVHPEITVASLAFRNVFRHPGRDAINRIHRFSERNKFTSKNGAIRFRSDGNKIQIIDWRSS